MFDLGLTTDIQVDEEIIIATIKRLEKEFDLILVTEYFDESLFIWKNNFAGITLISCIPQKIYERLGER